MADVIASLAALVSAVATVIGAAISWSQWRDSRAPRGAAAEPAEIAPARAASPTPWNPAASAQPAPPTRAGRAALGVAVLACAIAAVGNTLFVLQQKSSNPARGLETLLNAVALPLLLISLLGAFSLSVFLLVRGLTKKRNADLKSAALTLLSSGVALLSMWVTDALT
jgi:hypothetical protein